ncbi:MAG: T6SS effector amidase Tae4 family protein [Sphingobium sp.]
METLYTALGGAAERNIFIDGFGPDGNTCASRMSVAFNRGGSPIVAARVGARETLGTADGTRIIFTVSAFRRYLIATLGKPLTDRAGPFDSDFVGRRGIVAFSVNWRGATGHIAPWNGAVYREPAYDNYAAYVNSADPSRRTSLGEFWELR